MSTKSSGQQTATQNSSMAAKIRSLEILKETISRHQAHLETLCAERDQLERELEAFQSMNPVVHRLPVEVLTEIFKEVIEYKDSIVRSIPVANHGRITLAQVCKAWRTVVNNTPALWKAIHLKVPHGTENYFGWTEKMDRYLDQWLARSGDTGLTVLMDLKNAITGSLYAFRRATELLRGLGRAPIRLAWPDGVRWDQFPVAEEYESKLDGLIGKIVGEGGEKMKNWRKWNLFLPEDEDSLDRICPLLNYPASQLQDLKLESTEWTWGDSPVPLTRFLPFPSLRTLHVYGTPLQIVTSCPQLRQLRITVQFLDAGWDDLLFLTTFPLLEELRFRIDVWAPEHIKFSTVHIPFLKHLHFEQRPPRQMLQALDIAQISRLTIEDLRGSVLGYPEAPLFIGAQHVCLIFKHQGENTKTVLQTLLPQLSSSHTIEVTGVSFNVAQRMIEYEKGRGNLGLLRRLVAQQKYGGFIERIYPID